MPKYRQGRINDSVAQEISLILRDVKDPRVSDGMITITGADVSADLKYAKIFYSLYDGDAQDVGRGLRSASGFIRSQLAHRLNMRITPELSFVFDTSVRHGAHIAELLGKLNISGDAPAEEENKDDSAE